MCDKTGTLTKGVFQVTEIHPEGGMSEADLLEKAALVESYSNHPISKSLKEAYGKEIDNNRVTNAKEISGHGVSAVVDGHEVAAGNVKLMKQMNIQARFLHRLEQRYMLSWMESMQDIFSYQMLSSQMQRRL